MQIVDLQNNNSQSLILFFAGWGYDETCVAHLKSGTFDVKVVYDYRSIEPLEKSFFDAYKSVTVIAWSFGVWGANVALNKVATSVNQAFAINGTLNPVDDFNGIPQAVFTATVDALTERSYQKFQARVMGGSANLKLNESYLAKRPFGEQKEELEMLAKSFNLQSNNNLQWNKALCGDGDLIFPIANLKNFWGDKAILKPYPHFMFDKFVTWSDLLNDFNND